MKSKEELNDMRAVLRNKQWNARAAESLRMDTAPTYKESRAPYGW